MDTTFQNTPAPAGKDEKMWNVAKARAGFKTHFTVYIVVMGILWLIWILSGGLNIHPWPIYPTLGWGIGVLFNYLAVYKFDHSVEEEYERLMKEKH
ncbi:MAG: 2TM domain-containing protein [Sphingobacteriales bacterium]|nr:2TM domain-containing protein [Sphingobacteriales bacterium]MBI3717840.1 2TM domain-containing protein [Sphingobacteriales bacterium]